MPKEKILLNDFREYRFLSELAYSPNGKAAAFVVSKANEKNDYDSNIWVYQSESGFTQMTFRGKEKNLLWLDDNNILFITRRDEDKKEQPPQGEELTSFYQVSLNDGKIREAFTVERKVGSIRPVKDGLYLLNATVDNSRPDLTGKSNEEKSKLLAQYEKEKKAWQIIDELPYWSNGRHFTNKLRHRLYLFDIVTGELIPISNPLTDAGAALVSPCGKYIAYTGKHYKNLMPNQNTLYLYSIETGETKEIIKDSYRVSHFAWWKDDKIVFTASLSQNYGNSENHCFYLCDLKTGEVSLLSDYDYSIGSGIGSDCRLGGGTTFKLVGDELYFTSNVGFYSNLYKMDVNTGTILLICGQCGSVDQFTIAGDSILTTAFVGNRLQEVYEVRDGMLRRLSDFNNDFYEKKDVKAPVYHPFTNADGISIDGWMILPRDYDPNRKYPAILDIHGGPKSLFGDIYFHEMQYWASEGYFVMFCNPRGSDGKGNVFADIRGKYGTIDYDDIMMFVDQMLETYPAIDPSRLGVTGGSYGGFMTNWIIGHTHRFAAAATQRSIANWLSFNYISDIGYYFGPDQQAADNWDDPEKLWFHSPMKYLNNAKTPTLVIHSDEDHRCPDVEGYQIFSALQKFGVESRMVLFHGENHELSRSGKPDNREKRLAEITAWMDRFLK